MIGQVALLDTNHFNFKLVGSNPSDPGLTFAAKSGDRATRVPQSPQPEIR